MPLRGDGGLGGPLTPREWDAASYDQVAAPMTARGVELVDRLDLRGDETVLDAGCGSGQVTAHLLTRLPEGRVIALDGSRRMLDAAAERFAGDARVRLVQADLEAPLPLDAPVDGVISTSTFHWVRDHAALFANLASVMTPGARLLAECGGAGNIASVLEILGEDPAPTWTFATPAETERRLLAAGFARAEAALVERPAPIPGGWGGLREYLRTVVFGAHVAREGETVVEKVAAGLAEPVIDYVRLMISATR